MPNEELEPSTPEAPAEAIPSTPEDFAKVLAQTIPQNMAAAMAQLTPEDLAKLLSLLLKAESEQVKDQSELKKQRGNLATWLVGMMAVSLVVFTGFLFTDKKNETSARELITLFWTSQVGLVGGVVGYYFGADSKE
ncbi:MAG: hypothetical protein QQW96_12770 [Tychonema bourrellyi B0820]|uniref:Uncharacterized protein n=1 Tax=Tychonema bourrellyi FEM_GT703 TaxID=2040638 RepID=A0A2G4EZ27_9CYAN|nr:hypothetical protein [Tychonema bourrellyi]MDQ2098507.1 hypothetical protein [Tychonema bourrellyi B0820]PHX54728.1 hypothetical protein CP500_014560 [Tychonema bourrellyi FEM_GT703]